MVHGGQGAENEVRHCRYDQVDARPEPVVRDEHGDEKRCPDAEPQPCHEHEAGVLVTLGVAPVGHRECHADVEQRVDADHIPGGVGSV